MLNRIGYGKGIVVFEREPRVQIGRAYQPQQYPHEDQEWIQQVLFSQYRSSYMEFIWAVLFLIGFVVLVMGG